MTTRLALVTLIAIVAAQPAAARPPYSIRPRVELWTNRGDDVVHRGERVRVFVRADRDAFVTVFRVDTDGRVRVLFPRDPWEDSFARSGREYEIEGMEGRDAFFVDDYPGVGYLFAVAAADPFDYGAIVTGDHWDYRVIADGRVRGDPYVALTDLAERIVPAGYTDWDYDLVPYHVERHYDYPRFACYDCHAYASWTYWNPYDWYCSRFRIVIYDDPWYYPYRYYGGTRVVIVRPYRPPPRYVFKEWGGSSRDRPSFITRVRQRPAGEDRGRVISVNRRDIPVPRSREADRPRSPDDDRERRDRPDRAERPDRPNRVDQDRTDGPARVVPVPRSGQPDGRDRSERSGGEAERRGMGERDGSGRARVERPERTPHGAERGRGAQEGRQGLSEAERAPDRRSEGRPQSGARGGDRGEQRRAAPPAERGEARGRESGGRPSTRESPRAAPDRSAGREAPSRPEQSKPELKRRRPD